MVVRDGELARAGLTDVVEERHRRGNLLAALIRDGEGLHHRSRIVDGGEPHIQRARRDGQQARSLSSQAENLHATRDAADSQGSDRVETPRPAFGSNHTLRSQLALGASVVVPSTHVL